MTETKRIRGGDELDTVDNTLVALLQADSRMSNSRLATKQPTSVPNAPASAQPPPRTRPTRMPHSALC